MPKISGRRLMIVKAAPKWDFYDYKNNNKPMSKSRKKWSKYVRQSLLKDTNNQLKNI